MSDWFKRENPKPAPAPAPRPEDHSPFQRGVDVSHYQAGINWAEVKRLGYNFCSIKATDGKSRVESTLAVQRHEAHEAGLVVGVYHFFRFGDSPIDQAHNLMRATGGLNKGELPFMLDVEPDRFSEKYKENKPMGDAAADMVYTCLVEIERLSGMTPIIYTNYYFFQGFKNPERFARFTPWIPAYNTTVEKVKIPKPWNKLVFWQYSESLKIAGVDAVDGDMFFGTLEQLKRMCK